VNSGGTSYGADMTFTTPATVADVDGNVYNTVVIGTQTWMKENLKTTKYSDGSSITNVMVYQNNESNSIVYGRLYLWDDVMHSSPSSNAVPSGVQGACPTGWHIPSDNEWKLLETYLGIQGSEVDLTEWRGIDEGGKLKEAGTVHWISPNSAATNSSGFSSVPGGYKYTNLYDRQGYSSYYWTCTASDFMTASHRQLDFDQPGIRRTTNSEKIHYFSVRCVKN
jgi:uncharacterized protein (TIGR02145 family)